MSVNRNPMARTSRTRLTAVLLGGLVLGAAGGIYLTANPSAGARFIPVARAQDAIDTAIANFEERMKGADTQGKRTAIAEISQKKDPRVAAALKPFLRDPDKDVRITICQNIGLQKDPKIASLLMAIADDKKNREHPDLVAAAVQGIGDANPKGSYKFLLDVAKKQVNISADVAGAAFRGLANVPHPDTVDDLISQLDVVSSVTTDDGPVKAAARNGSKPVIIECLKKLTGQPISDTTVWKDWWKDNKKTWRPTAADAVVDINASDEYKDTAYRFMLKKASKAWFFRKQPDSPNITLEAMDEGQRAAWIEIRMQETKNLKSKTPEAMAEEQKPNFESKMKDLKEDSYWGKKISFAGEGAAEDRVFGRHADWDAVAIRNVYVERDGVIFLITGVWKSGKSKALHDDIDKILATFRFLK